MRDVIWTKYNYIKEIEFTGHIHDLTFTYKCHRHGSISVHDLFKHSSIVHAALVQIYVAGFNGSPLRTKNYAYQLNLKISC